MVIGGGNTAMDAARSAIRLGAEKVSIVYRRSREEMPAWKVEIHEAEEEGAQLQLLRNPIKLLGENGRVNRALLIKMELGEPDASGRRSPVEVKGSEYEERVDMVIEAIGLQPTTSSFGKEIGLNKTEPSKLIKTHFKHPFPGSLQAVIRFQAHPPSLKLPDKANAQPFTWINTCSALIRPCMNLGISCLPSIKKPSSAARGSHLRPLWTQNYDRWPNASATLKMWS